MNTFRMFSRVLVIAVVMCAGNMNAGIDQITEDAVEVARAVVTSSQIQGMAAGVAAAGVVKYGCDKAQAISQDGIDQHSLLIGTVFGGAVGLYTGNVKAGLVSGAATVGAIKLAVATKDTELSKSLQEKLGKVAQSSAAQVGGLVVMNGVIVAAAKRAAVQAQ